MLIQPETPSDHAAIRAVVEAAFPTADEAALVDRLRAEGDAVISLVARDGEGVVGHILFSRLTAPVRALGLAPVAVLPARQREGIGSRLIHRGLAEAATSGWESILVLGDPGYYRRFGFDPALATGVISPYAGPHLMALNLAPRRLPLTGRFDYPPAFAALA